MSYSKYLCCFCTITIDWIIIFQFLVVFITYYPLNLKFLSYHFFPIDIILKFFFIFWFSDIHQSLWNHILFHSYLTFLTYISQQIQPFLTKMICIFFKNVCNGIAPSLILSIVYYFHQSISIIMTYE